ncbi:MAG: hypothetical protein ACR2QQ_06400 [Gammaproteobacteria bacterium]
MSIMRVVPLCLVLIPLLLLAAPVDAEREWEVLERVGAGSSGHVLSRGSSQVAGASRYRMVTTLEAPPAVVARAAIVFLTDDRYTPAGQVRTILRSDEREILTHLRIDVPLASDRDVVTRIVFDEQGGTHRLDWREVDGAAPDPAQGVVRIPHLRGSFELREGGLGVTAITYDTEVDLGGRLPAAIVASFFPRQIKAQMDGLRRAVADSE